MTPIKFKEAQIELGKPSNMTDEECSGLWIHRADNYCTSLWTTGFMERLKFLFHGHIWIRVLSGQTQPPIILMCQDTIFEYPEQKKSVGELMNDQINEITEECCE